MEVPEKTMQQVYEQAIGSMSIEIARSAAMVETLRAELQQRIDAEAKEETDG